MTLKPFSALAIGALIAGFTAPAISATVTTNLGAYSVTYDNATDFGSISAVPASGSAVSFQFAVPSTINVVGSQVAAFVLPEFKVTVNSGYVLSGAVTGLIGQLAYTEFTGGTTLASVSGNLAVDNGAPVSFSNVLLSKVQTGSSSGGTVGHYVGSAGVPFGPFSTLTFSGGTLNLASDGFASIVSTQQNVFNISFNAALVPEPESYAMLLAGLGLLGAMVRRRSRQG